MNTSRNFSYPSLPQYFTDEEATEKAFKGGYFHSGDLAVMYPDGSIGIQDRSKDIIISGGEVGDPDAMYILAGRADFLGAERI